MFNWTVISDVPRGIANTTDLVGTELIMMSPVTTEITLESKTSGGRMSRHRKVAMGACVGWTILLIVAEKMTLKALCHRASGSGSEGVRMREYSSGGREYASAIGEVDVLSCVSRNGESSVVRIG